MTEDNSFEQQPSADENEPEQAEPEGQSEPQARREPQTCERDDSAQPLEEKIAAAVPSAGPAGEPIRVISGAERKRMNRRELLKLVPVLAVGAFAIPKFRQPLLDEGLHFSDWASGKLFGRHRLAQTFSDSDVVPSRTLPV